MSETQGGQALFPKEKARPYVENTCYLSSAWHVANRPAMATQAPGEHAEVTLLSSSTLAGLPTSGQSSEKTRVLYFLKPHFSEFSVTAVQLTDKQELC